MEIASANRGAAAAESARTVAHPAFSEAFRFWLKLGFISFGGPTGQIAIMHAELVEKRRWISEARFLHALNYCMLLPGPEAQQLATYVGWLLHRTWGGVVAGSLFVLPSAVLLWALSYVYAAHGSVPWIAAIFAGLKPAVTAIVAHAVVRIGKRALKTGAMWTLAGVAFAGIFVFDVPFPLIVVGAGLIGLMGGQRRPDQFVVIKPHGSTAGRELAVLDDASQIAEHARPSLSRAVRVCVVCLALWSAPILTAAAIFGPSQTLVQEGLFFSKAAMVTFGGAYAVLPYVAQQAVERFGWLTAPQMLDGLGLAETTPGPLIMVVQFVGFLGGWHHAGELSPLLAATLGAAMATWTTFVPCFLWIFLGAPFIERLRGHQGLTASLSAVTAAVVGVVLNLAVWFGLHVFLPAPNTVDWFAVGVCAVALAGLIRFKIDVMAIVGLGAVAGLIRWLILPF